MLVAVASLVVELLFLGGGCLFQPVLLQFIPLLKLFFTVFPQGLTASGVVVVAGGGGVMLGIPAGGE